MFLVKTVRFGTNAYRIVESQRLVCSECTQNHSSCVLQLNCSRKMDSINRWWTQASYTIQLLC